MSQLEANREILKQLTAYAEKYPYMRFGQILWNTDVVTSTQDKGTGRLVWADDFYTDSETILERMRSE